MDWQATDNIDFFAKAAWVTLDDNETDPITMYVPNTGTTFFSPGITFDKNWGEYGIGAAWKLTKKMTLTGEAGGSNYPEDWYTSIALVIGW